MRTRGARTALGAGATVALAIVAIGCGGDGGKSGAGGGSDTNAGGERARVLAAVSGIGDAFAQSDAKAVCALLTKRARSDAANTIPGANSCESGAERLFSITKGSDRKRFGRLLKKLEKRVLISGDRATVTAPGTPGAKPIELRREGGSWKLAKNPFYYHPN
jgi:hypothetical protein